MFGLRRKRLPSNVPGRSPDRFYSIFPYKQMPDPPASPKIRQGSISSRAMRGVQGKPKIGTIRRDAAVIARE